MAEFSIFWRLALYGLLLIAAVGDVRRFQIPNIFPILVLVMLAAALIFTTPAWEPEFWYDFVSRMLGGVIATEVALLFFALRVMGGGDVKLFAALSFWFGLDGLFGFAVFTAFSGLVLGLVYGVYYLVTKAGSAQTATECPNRTGMKGGASVVHEALRGRAPYGVAIFLGAVLAGESNLMVVF